MKFISLIFIFAVQPQSSNKMVPSIRISKLLIAPK